MSPAGAQAPVAPARPWSSLHDLWRGIRVGAACGAAVAVMRLAAQLFPAWGAPTALALVAPVGAGALSGGLLGALWPVRRSGGAAIALGLMAMWLFAAGVALAWTNGNAWDALRTPVWPLLGAVAGLPLGALVYDLGQATTPEQARVIYLQARRGRYSSTRPTPWTVCPCCGFPTYEQSGGLPHCHLCEWEPSDGSDAPAHDLANPQANFARFGTIYDPASPPVWLTRPMSAEAQAARAEMNAALTPMETEQRPRELCELWRRFYAAEARLNAATARDAER